MTTILALVLVCQDPGAAVQGRVRKGDGEHELAIRGRSAELEEGSEVRLRFRRIVNRVDWERGRIETGPAEASWDRSAPVESGMFFHRETIAVPGEIQVEIRAGESGPITRVFRVGQGSDLAVAVRRGAQRIEASLGAARDLLEELEAVLEPPGMAARRAKDLRRRAQRRIAAWREEAGGSALSASAGLLSGVISDLEAAIDCAAGGRPCEGVVSSVSGMPFSTAQARGHLDQVEAVLLRERALFVVRGAAVLREEIVRAAASGCPFAWSRVESQAGTSLAAFRQAVEDLSCAPLGDGPDSMAALVEGTGEVLGLAGSAVHCPRSVEGRMEERLRSLEEQTGRVEQALRTLR